MTKTFLVTGATDGVGRITARLIAELGHEVLVHGRTASKATDAAKKIQQETANNSVHGYHADLGDLDEVRTIAGQVLTNHPRIDGLINNAGIGPAAARGERVLSTDGHELRFQVNYLSLVLLTELLLPALKAANGRVVNLASVAQEEIDLNDLMTEKRFSGMKTYARSKLAVVMYSFTLAERMKNIGVMVNAMDPGSLLATKMVSAMGVGASGSAEDGARREVQLALSPEFDGTTGKYFSEGYIDRAHAQAYDNNVRIALWAQTKNLLNLQEAN
ncbi:MAG: SDR family NAD(P)-dependent oxidoreductase [Gammaproteobacteria bacterium]|nr:SDR family NAD(P)-dependent oxidoreductase [Gammaproteobacteria bacterium]